MVVRRFAVQRANRDSQAAGIGSDNSDKSLVRAVGDPERDADMRPLSFGIICRLLGYMAPYAWKRNWLLACVVLRSIQLPLVAWAIGAVINGPIANRAAFHQIAWGGCGVLCLAAFTQVTFHFRYRYALELGEFVVHDLRNQVFQHLQQMPMAYFNHTKLGRIISRVTSDCEAMRVGVQDVLFVSMVGIGQMLVSSALMLWYDAILFLVVVAMTPVLWAVNRIFRHRLSRAYRDVQESFSRVTATLAESIAGIRVTQGFARQRRNAKLFQELVSDHAEYNMTAAKTAGAFLPLLELNSQLFVAALLLVGGYRVLHPQIQMPVGDLIQFFFLAGIFFSPIQILGNQYNQALTAMAGAERVFALLDTRPAWRDVTNATELPRLQGNVELRKVSFGYTADRRVLRDISLCVQPGEIVALVGPTGSGKTTLVNLLARFYLPCQGQLLCDGYDLAAVSSQSYHHQIAIVLQHNFLFTGTIRDNIRFAQPKATDAEIVQTLEALGCADLLLSLPDGLDAQVGERGGKLSLGQRQLVCFARAMLPDPRILLLDEATSAVDTVTEARLQSALRTLLANRTSFVVAHRLSTIRRADQVVVLRDGQVAEVGRPQALLASQNSLYACMLREYDAADLGR